ncbi:amino acid adenylation domain-containing protein, partial [Paenibacillus dendritiformis]|uniref:amino acid adenylation domain-containing protein n=1 Tax=Paenibacillus dendritiformis TaxID=130049 RepID=UPI00387E10B5
MYNNMSSIPYGRPLANQTLFVLNFKLQLCPVGVPGELYIGGAGLAQGYHNDPDRTESAFITHPQWGKLYKTGDLGVLHKTGLIEFLGRKDHQVKIKGYRIEIGEIEARLREINGIHHVVVTDREDEKRKKYLCAYVVTEDIDTASIKNELRKVLPAYMIPTYILAVDHIPLTANGKIDRKALPEPSTFQSDPKVTAPQSEMQRIILHIWEQILGVTMIGIEDNFFELGGDSLQAQQLVNMLEQKFNVHLPIRKIFMEPTIEGISRMLQDGDYNVTRESVTSKGLIADQTVHYYWSPRYSWRPENGGITIGTQHYSGIAEHVVPTIYFLTQEGIALKEIENHFPDLDHGAVYSIIDKLIKARVLVHGIMTPAEVFATQSQLMKHYENEHLIDSVAYKRHKFEQLNRSSSTLIETPEIQLQEEREGKHFSQDRKTYRVFDETVEIPFDTFSELLSVFKQMRKDDEIRYQYASAGGLYSIDVYIEVKDQRVEQVKPGIYYYDPIRNSLKLVNNEGLSEEQHYFNNKQIYRSSAFSVFFVYNAKANAPVYGSSGYYYACIDTGIMVGIFTQRAESLGIGLCSIGEMNFADAQDKFRLNPTQIHLHTVEGGLKSDQNVTHYPSVSGVPAEGIQESQHPERYIASSPQQRLFILQMLYPDQTAYNNPIAMEMDGTLDVGKLEMVINHLLMRHEILRTSFELQGEDVIQVIHPNQEIKLHCMQAQDSTVEELIESVIKPFELNKAPLIRINLFQLSPVKHILILDAHHIILDRISGTIFAKDLMELYQENSLSPLKTQYKDFSERQRKMVGTEAYRLQQQEWLSIFAGEIPVLQLPTDCNRPASQNFNGGTYRFSLEPELLTRIKSMSFGNNVTLYMALLAAFKVLLFKYTGQDDLIVGSPVAGRLHQDFEHTLGMFANTVAIRSRLDVNETFEKFMQQIKENVLQVFEIQAFPFEKLVDQLQLPKDMSRNPLFDVMFTLQNIENSKLSLNDLQITPYPLEGKTAKFDLTLEAQENDYGLSLVLEYGRALFDEDTIKRMAGYFKNIVEIVSANPRIVLKDIDMLSDIERNQVLSQFSETKKDYPEQFKIIRLFEQQSARLPKSIAVTDGAIQLTYEELNQKANKLARTLKSMGVMPNEIIGIIADRSVDTIVGILGILKAGAAYLPIDPEYPTNRISFLLNNSGASLVLTGDHISQIETSTCRILSLTAPSIYHSVGENLEEVGHPDDLFYVIYTSGTTGTPKGVQIGNRSFMNLVHWYKEEFHMTSEDRILLTSSLSFDLTQKNVFAALVSGAQLHLFKSPSYNYSSLIRRIEDEQITLLNCTPSAFYPLAEWTAKTDYVELRSLRHVFLGGEPIDSGRVEGWLLSANGKAQIVNTYGPTECTDVSAFHRIEITDQSTGIIPIGKPLPNVQLYILDANQQLLPQGIEGELYISGDCVGFGYLNDAVLTDQKFVRIPGLSA